MLLYGCGAAALYYTRVAPPGLLSAGQELRVIYRVQCSLNAGIHRKAMSGIPHTILPRYRRKVMFSRHPLSLMGEKRV